MIGGKQQMFSARVVVEVSAQGWGEQVCPKTVAPVARVRCTLVVLKSQVGIVGAGIGGLCLAQHLRRRGVEVIVFEQDSSPMGRTQGYRLTLRDTETVLRGCLPGDVYELFDRSSGSVDGLDFMDHQLDVRKSLAITARSVDRSTFKKVLLKFVGVQYVVLDTQAGRVRLEKGACRPCW
ncbi:NAD(P)-binding protein, partial [Nocardia sp. NPDC051052]|uniref:NAD(P)-binding protein n=1 Tax=Nocardia sp. NPDC051052 TaxID=3364322 RepID=UPI00379FEC15